FITALGAAATWTLAVRAQQPARMKRIAYVQPGTKVSEMNVRDRPYLHAFFGELGRVGYVEGQNITVEQYSGEGQPERYAGLAVVASQFQPARKDLRHSGHAHALTDALPSGEICRIVAWND